MEDLPAWAFVGAFGVGGESPDAFQRPGQRFAVSAEQIEFRPHLFNVHFELPPIFGTGVDQPADASLERCNYLSFGRSFLTWHLEKLPEILPRLCHGHLYAARAADE